MKCQDVRGAATSKIAQCAPALRSEALALGRWTTEATFIQNYEFPVDRVSRLDDEIATSCQHVLRWGFRPKLPGDMPPESYQQRPAHWVGQRFSFGMVTAFDDGIYSVKKGRSSRNYTHWELMELVANGSALKRSRR